MPNFTITPSTGTGLTTVSATPVSQNLTYSAKTGTVTISNGQSTKTVTLRQNGLPHTIPSMETIHLASTGGTIPFDVESDHIFCFSGYTTSDWVVINNGSTVQPPEGSAGGPMVWGIYPNYDTWDLSMVVGANTGSQRTATIYLDHYYDNTGTITKAPYSYPMSITQDGAGGHYLYLSENLTELNDSSYHPISAFTDVAWEVSSYPSWLTVFTGSGIGNGTFWLEPNGSYESMQRGEIVVSDTQGLGLSQTLVVYLQGYGSNKGYVWVSDSGFTHYANNWSGDTYVYDDVTVYVSTAKSSVTLTSQDSVLTFNGVGSSKTFVGGQETSATLKLNVSSSQNPSATNQHTIKYNSATIITDTVLANPITLSRIFDDNKRQNVGQQTSTGWAATVKVVSNNTSRDADVYFTASDYTYWEWSVDYPNRQSMFDNNDYGATRSKTFVASPNDTKMGLYMTRANNGYT